MNKLGFYIENTTVPFLRDAMRQVRPPVLLIHAGDRGLLRDIRRELSPDSFVVGRMFIPQSEQDAWLRDPDPEGRGRALADMILNYDMGLAQERGANGRLLIDAWMVLNEAVRGPASFPDGQPDAETLRRAEALDRLQVAYRARLQERGVDAVAFNFGAGNYTHPAHYVNLFPRTLAAYTYLGFHEYGWPTLRPRAGTATAALLYRGCMEGIRQRWGDRHRAIITEAGLARMYRHPHDPAGDVGWLYPGDPVSEEQYWDSLHWYNTELLRDRYVLGACLFSVGHSGRWETFRHLGTNHQGRPILLMSRVATLGSAAPLIPPAPQPVPAPTDTPEPKPRPPAPSDPALRARLAAVEKFLSQTVQQTTRLEGLHAEMQTALKTLRQATATLPDDLALSVLCQQIDALEAAVQRYAADADSIVYPPDLSQLQWRISRLCQAAEALQHDTGQAVTLRTEIVAAGSALDQLGSEYGVIPALKRRAEGLLAEVQPLCVRLGPARRPTPVEPPLTDLSTTLPSHRRNRWPAQDPTQITRIVVHHTGDNGAAPPEKRARAAIRAQLPGIPYHFLIATDGAISLVQPVAAQVEPTPGGISVALAGTFDVAVPSDAQLEAAARLIGWLLARHGLPTAAVTDADGASPGLQWSQGRQYSLDLLERLPDGLEHADARSRADLLMPISQI